MTPSLQEWLQSLRAVETYFHHVPGLERLFFYFRYEGLGSVVLWILALVLLLASPASVATLFASTVLAMGACLAAELLGLSTQAIRRLKAKES